MKKIWIRIWLFSRSGKTFNIQRSPLLLSFCFTSAIYLHFFFTLRFFAFAQHPTSGQHNLDRGTPESSQSLQLISITLNLRETDYRLLMATKAAPQISKSSRRNVNFLHISAWRSSHLMRSRLKETLSSTFFFYFKQKQTLYSIWIFLGISTENELWKITESWGMKRRKKRV